MDGMMNKVINVVEQYNAGSDTLFTAITVNLKDGKQSFFLIEHETTSPYLISNKSLINSFRALADHIEKNHA